MGNVSLFFRMLLVLWMVASQSVHTWHFTMIVGATERGKRPLLSTGCAHGLLWGINLISSRNISLSFNPIWESSDSWLSQFLNPIEWLQLIFFLLFKALVFPCGTPLTRLPLGRQACEPCSPACRRRSVSLLAVSGLRWHDSYHVHQKGMCFFYVSVLQLSWTRVCFGGKWLFQYI